MVPTADFDLSLAVQRDMTIIDLAFYRVKRRQAASHPETQPFVATWDSLIAKTEANLADVQRAIEALS